MEGAEEQQPLWEGMHEGVRDALRPAAKAEEGRDLNSQASVLLRIKCHKIHVAKQVSLSEKAVCMNANANTFLCVRFQNTGMCL